MCVGAELCSCLCEFVLLYSYNTCTFDSVRHFCMKRLCYKV